MSSTLSTVRDWPVWTLTGRAAVPAASPTLTSPSLSRRPRPAPPARVALHPLEHPQTHRLPVRPLHPHRSPLGTSPAGACRAGTTAPDPARPPDQLPAHPYLEGLPRPGLRRQAGPDRGGEHPVPRPVFRVRPVRAAVDPALSRHLLGAKRRVESVVHRSGDIGSPRMSGSTRASNAGRSPLSVSATRLRPPPGRRTRPSGAALESSSVTPRDTVASRTPAARATSLIPPCPHALASAARNRRR
jgi:hypothetical protein